MISPDLMITITLTNALSADSKTVSQGITSMNHMKIFSVQEMIINIKKENDVYE